MNRTRSVWRALAAFAGAAALVAGASVFANQSTSASWNDQVGFTTPVTAAAASVTPTGSLSFTNLDHYWVYGTGGVVGVRANLRVRFMGTGTIPSISLVLDIENNDNQYLVGGAPVLSLGSPEWAAAGVGETVTNDDGIWIRYRFLWTGSLANDASTAVLEASVPFTVPVTNPPESSRWTIIATADGVEPATGEGTSATFIKQPPP